MPWPSHMEYTIDQLAPRNPSKTRAPTGSEWSRGHARANGKHETRPGSTKRTSQYSILDNYTIPTIIHYTSSKNLFSSYT